MKVYLSDHKFNPDLPGDSQWLAALTNAFGGDFIRPLRRGRHEPPISHDAFEDPSAILFVHSGDQTGWLDFARRARCQIVLVRSIGGQTENCEALPNLHCCYWRPEEFIENPPLPVQRFISLVRNGPVDLIEWGLLQPDFDAIFFEKIRTESFGGGGGGDTDRNFTATMPVADSLREILGEEPNLAILDYKNHEAFSRLWSEGLSSPNSWFPDGGADSIKGDGVLLIVGEDPPGEICRPKNACLGGINFRGNLSSASWAAAWRLKFPSAKMRVVLLSSSPYESGGAVVQALYTLFRATGADDSPLVPGVRHLRSPSLVLLREAIRAGSEGTPKLPFAVKDMLRSVLWGGMTSDREAHHAVSNVIGALLLSGGDFERHPGDSALPCLLSLAEIAGARVGLGAPCYPWLEPDLQREIGSALLFDDMADLWVGFLRGALGLNGGLPDRHLFSTSPNHFYENLIGLENGSGRGGLCERLRAFLKSRRAHLSPADLIAGASPDDRNFVLFLDVRLFSASMIGACRGGFYRELAEIGLELLAKPVRRLSWLSKTSQSKLEMELKLMAGGEEPPGVDTMLPRLLSLLDPTVPIVLFTSTHHSDLIDPLRDYGNIITSFRKPVLKGMATEWGETVSDLQKELRFALEQAARILRVRRVIHSFRDMAVEGATDAQSVVIPARKEGHLVEVFFDESLVPPKQTTMCVGGIVVVRALDEGGNPTPSDQAIVDALHARHLLWGWSPEVAPEDYEIPLDGIDSRTYSPKGNSLKYAEGEGLRRVEEQVEAVRAVLGKNGTFFPFAFVAERSPRNTPNWMSVGDAASAAESILDGTLRQLIRHAVEGLLFRANCFRDVRNNAKSKFALDFGTRWYPLPPFAMEGMALLQQNYGVVIHSSRERKSIEPEDGVRMTAELIADAGGGWPFAARIVRARGVALRDFGDGNRGRRKTDVLLPNQLHYFADWIANGVLHRWHFLTASPALRDFFESGWIVDFRRGINDPTRAGIMDPEEPARLRIAREWDRGRRVDAILKAANLKKCLPRNGIGINLYRQLRKGAMQLDGGELTRLFSRLPCEGGVEHLASVVSREVAPSPPSASSSPEKPKKKRGFRFL